MEEEEYYDEEELEEVSRGRGRRRGWRRKRTAGKGKLPGERRKIEGGKAKFMAFYAKQSRGLMARWMADHRPKTVAALRNFDAEGYTLSKDSTDDTLVFTRPKPLPIAQRRKTG